MSDRKGLFTGSFDPITKGHLELIERASQLFDQLYVGIFYNPDKIGSFSIAQRVRMVEKAVAHLENVQVVTSSHELAVTVAKRLGVTVLVRGLRNAQDLVYEANMDYFNHQLAPAVETIYLYAQPPFQALSSSRIRELLTFDQDISPYVPKSVIEELEDDRKNETTGL